MNVFDTELKYVTIQTTDLLNECREIHEDYDVLYVDVMNTIESRIQNAKNAIELVKI